MPSEPPLGAGSDLATSTWSMPATKAAYKLEGQAHEEPFAIWRLLQEFWGIRMYGREL